MLKLQKIVCCLLLSFCYTIAINAQKQNPYSAIPLIGDSIKTGGTLLVHDTVFYNTDLNKLIASTRHIDNIISLSLIESSGLVMPDSFNIKVCINTDLTDTNGLTINKKDTLTINYSKSGQFNNKSIKLYSGIVRANTRIDNVLITGSSPAAAIKFARLDNTVSIERYFKPAITSYQTNTSPTRFGGPDIKDEHLFTWPASATPCRYDVEWTFIDKAALDAGFYNDQYGNLDPSLIFKNNASRVTVSANSYSIPLFFEGDGSLFYRDRTTQIATTGEIILGPWDQNLINYRFDFTGHQTNLNWQATTTFAEDGKRKSVVSYFDGNLKSRQTVTKDNTTGKTIVAETFYDKQGRPQIQVLPVPTLNNAIAYTANFNVGLNSAEYDKDVYDPVISNSDYCPSAAPALSTVSGAAQYYSPANSLTTTSFNQYIPDANQFPFAETRYTRDNSGRIDKQGGVGKEFQLNSDHETRYFYSTAQQSNLDALFGTEVGDASHYSKNMVRDANGQYSVSYIDMNGKTIATALAGDSPTSLNKLDSYGNVSVTDNLLTPTNNLVEGNTIRSFSSISVPINAQYVFNYGLNPETLTIADCQNRNICYDCLYDINITVSDDCGNVWNSNQPYKFTNSNFKMYQIDTSCQAVTPISQSFSLSLKEGNYNITKELSISKYAMDYYKDSLFIPHNTCKTYQDILSEQSSLIKSRIDCTPQNEENNYVDAIHDRMVADMVPGSGQYADETGNNFNSIFRRIGFFHFFERYQSLSTYKDENGKPDSVYNSNGTKVPPQLLSQDEFISNYKESWGETLIQLHPEYNIYRQYVDLGLRNDYTWVADFQNTDTYADAVKKGYLNPTRNTQNELLSQLPQPDPSTTPDPLRGHIFMPAAIDGIDNGLFSYYTYYSPDGSSLDYSAWTVANAAVKCPDPNDDNCINNWNNSGAIFNPAMLCQGELDLAWRNFRSIYLTVREKWVDDFTKSRAGTVHFYAGDVPVFPNVDATLALANYTNDQDYNRVQAQNNLNAYLDQNCKAYAIRWWKQLEPCNYTAADSAVIVPYLQQVCREGADPDHQFGSSTVMPSSTYRFRSFDDVIKFYNDSAYNGQKDHNHCNGYLINRPLPYNTSTLVVNQMIISKPSDCVCLRINALNDEWRYRGGYGNLSAYLFTQYQTSIKQSTLDSLLGLCGGTIACNFLSNPIMLPVILQCNQEGACANCALVQNTKTNFSIEFQGLIPTLDEPDSIQQHTNMLFENYMNNKLGFSKSAVEYLTFLSNCPKDVLNCTQLQSIQSDFIATYFNQNNLSDPNRFVDLDMVTFEGNKTPADGPKGVFNIWKNFIGNTVDGTSDQINKSFAEIWNSNVSNQFYGSLEALPTGKFRLHLKPNTGIPCEGIYGMRFYQFETPNANLDAVLTGPGSFIDFGDGTQTKVDSVAITISDLRWTGSVSSDWNNPQNWSPAIVPTKALNVTINSGTTFTPVITNNSVQINNLTIGSGSSFLLNNQKLSIAGNIINNGFIDATSGTIEFTGNNPQVINPGTFKLKSIKDLIISNTSSSGLTLNDTINILNSLSFGNVNNSHLNTNGLLVIRSNAANTGRIGDITNNGSNTGNSVVGNVTVERFIPSYNNVGNRILSSSVNSIKSIHDNWQEGATSPYDNPHPGYGTDITAQYNWEDYGFDNDMFLGFSLYSYNVNDNQFEPLPNTDQIQLDGKKAYYIYIAGDRSNGPQFSDTWSSNTTLRAYGSLLQGEQTYSGFTTSGSTSFQNTVANPFASPISWSKIYADNPHFSKYYTYLDPAINYGSYVTVDNLGFTCNPLSNASVNIQSGEGFFVHPIVRGVVLTISESDKSLVNNLKFFQPPAMAASLFTSLNFTDSIGIRHNADAIANRFNSLSDSENIQNNAVDIENTRENISIANTGSHLAVQYHSTLLNPDTINIFMNHMKIKQYDLEFKPVNFLQSGMTATLIDKYSNTQTNISFDSATIVPFSITSDSLSADSNRFSIILAPIPGQQMIAVQPAKDTTSVTDSTTMSFRNTSLINTSGPTTNIYPMPAGNYNFKPGAAYYTTHTYTTAATHTVTVYHSDIRGTIGFDNWGATATNLINITNLRGYVPDELLHVFFHSTQDPSINTFGNIKNRDKITKVKMINLMSGDGTTPFLNYNFGDLSANTDLRYIRLENIPGVKLKDILGSTSTDKFPSLSGLLVDANMYTDDVTLNCPNASYVIIQNGLKAYQVDTIINQLARSVQTYSGQLYLRFGNEPRTSASDAGIDALSYRGWRIFTTDNTPYVAPTQPDFSDTLNYNTTQYSTWSNYFSWRLSQDIDDNTLTQMFMTQCGSVPDGCVSIALGSKVINHMYIPPPAEPMLCGRAAIDTAVTLNFDPCQDTGSIVQQKTYYLYTIYQTRLKGSFEEQYRSKCLNAINLESFSVTHPITEYHYTLYYYDQAGNLVKTVPPAGVNPDFSDNWQRQVAAARANKQPLPRPHTMVTTYRYNTLNQVISQNTPDAGLSHFWYDRLGRLAISQNAKQITNNSYSYTLYDSLGRITEVGQKESMPQMTDNLSRDTMNLRKWLATTFVITKNGISTTLLAEQVTYTLYDLRDPNSLNIPSNYIVSKNFQKFYTLRNRVSTRRYIDQLRVSASGIPSYSGFDNSMTYSYDIHGNVDTLLNTYQTGLLYKSGLNRYKLIAYNYDLISGKVNQVHYQPGMSDAFYHRYDYDAENRLTDVYTTTRKELIGVSEDHESFYQYYLHGPLARTVLGQNQVQGLDYAYTLQGWLKGVNSTSLNPTIDMGQDGAQGSNLVKDAFSYSLNYFTGDYTPISTQTPFPGFSGLNGFIYRPLYNGNISSMAVNIGKFQQPMLYNYQYDQLNRLTGMTTFKGLDEVNNNWSGLTSVLDYKEQITYDANGNIKTYTRNGTGSSPINLLAYSYSLNANGKPINNKLNQVADDAPANANKISSQYTYDPIGNLITDQQANITNIDWSVYGKIRSISKGGNIEEAYTYDPSGNRISKSVNGIETAYVRDASGNIMATYATNQATQKLNQTEVNLYGSSRLGVYNSNIDVTSLTPSATVISTIGKKVYELTNHLGNVLATISNKRVAHSSDGINIDYFTSELISANDYYPFGMQMPGRTYNSSKYRYGFNGKENDNEVKGLGNQQDYGMRIYDPRIGRFLSVDPITAKYPFLTPYQFASNSPILCLDLDGLEGDPYSIGRAESSNRQYEAQLRKNDPQHAEERIYEENKQAFLTVGSWLSAGSGPLFTWFLSGVGIHGTYKMTKGIISKNQSDIKDGVNSLLFVALNKGASIVANKVVNIVAPRLYNFGIAALGEMGEAALSREMGSYKPIGKGSSIKTTAGSRFADGIPLGETIQNSRTLFEAKVGFQEYCGNIIKQVEKDAELLSSGKLDHIIWTFYRSPATGKVGASRGLLEALKNAGIQTKISGNIPKDIIETAILKYGSKTK